MFDFRMHTLFTCLAVILFSISLCSSTPADITGTKHDFSSTGDNTGQGFGLSSQKCNACHVPHNSDASGTYSLLWDHQITAAAFTLYSSETLDASVAQPDGSSRLCLSCHDGTVAVDAFGNRSGTTTITGSALIGTNLNDDHPVSFIYDTALAQNDGELYNPAATASGLGNTIQNDLLFNNKVQCASCHDAHDNTNGKFLRISNNRSALCLTCHMK